MGIIIVKYYRHEIGILTHIKIINDEVPHINSILKQIHNIPEWIQSFSGFFIVLAFSGLRENSAAVTALTTITRHDMIKRLMPQLYQTVDVDTFQTRDEKMF